MTCVDQTVWPAFLWEIGANLLKRSFINMKYHRFGYRVPDVASGNLDHCDWWTHNNWYMTFILVYMYTRSIYNNEKKSWHQYFENENSRKNWLQVKSKLRYSPDNLGFNRTIRLLYFHRLLKSECHVRWPSINWYIKAIQNEMFSIYWQRC